jgi:hypothetical protein
MPALAGCGLVFLPYARQFPGPVRVVKAVDADTREALPDADVRIRIARMSNWLILIPWLSCGGPDLPDAGKLAEPTAQRGQFKLKPQVACGWMQVWLPLPPVLGPAIMHEPYARLHVSAPEHDCLILQYSPARPPRPGEVFRPVPLSGAAACDAPPAGFATFGEGGILTFYLRRSAQAAESGPCAR